MPDEIVFKKRTAKGTGSARQKERQKSESPERDAEESTSAPMLSFKQKQKSRKQPRRSNLSFGGVEDTATAAADSSSKSKNSLLSQSISNRLPSRAEDGDAGDTSTTSTASNNSQLAIDQLKASTPSKDDVQLSITDEMDSEDGYSDIAKRIYGTAIKDSKQGPIPTTMAINTAKKKRHAGSQSTESDYLSLNLDGGNSSHSHALTISGDNVDNGGGLESRLQHEDDVFGDDVMGAFTGADESIHLTNQAEADALRRQRKERGEMIDEVMDEAEASDEEQQAWEKAQAKRAMAGSNRHEKDEEDDKEVYIPAPIPETTPLPTLNGAIARLRDMRVDGERAHSEKQKLSELSQKELVDLSQSESETRQQVEEVETRRSFFDDLRTWADDIASFLDDKEPELNKIEKRHDEIITERSSILSKRREGGEMATTLAPSEEGDYAKAKESIKGDVKRLFEDVKAATFLDPSQVLNEKFSEWRKAFGDEYLRAWAPLGMVSVWEFWTKVEMTGWDALRDSNKSIMTLKAYEFCHNYTSSHDTDDEMHTEDEEAKLNMDKECIPHLLSTIIIPHLIKHFGNGGYDPYNETETRYALDMVEMVEGGLSGMDDEKIDMLVMSLVQIVTSTINEIPANINTELAKSILKNAVSWRRIPTSIKQQTGYDGNVQQMRELLNSREGDNQQNVSNNLENNTGSGEREGLSAQENERRMKDLTKSDKDTKKMLKRREKDFKSAEKHLSKAEKAEAKANKKVDKTAKAQLKASEKKTAAEAKLNKANANSESAKQGLGQAKETHVKRKSELENMTHEREKARSERTKVEREIGSVKPTA
ncbi:hypothetical protein E3P96_00032 [Wallemia ichthyophaga]|nr:hypothetical protein E3P96_00032 [Wallemia ichthyophaga]